MDMKRIIFYLLVIFTAVTNAKNIKENSIIKDNCTRVKKDCVVMPDLSDTFIILTSDTVLTFDTDAHFPDEGIYRAEKPYNASRPRLKFGATYFLESKTRDVHIRFRHYNFNLDEIRKIRMPVATDTMKIITLPKDFLKRITPVDMDKKFPRIKNKKEAHDFITNLERKRVWIIDRRYLTDSTVTLIETRIGRVPIGF